MKLKHIKNIVLFVTIIINKRSVRGFREPWLHDNHENQRIFVEAGTSLDHLHDFDLRSFGDKTWGENIIRKAIGKEITTSDANAEGSFSIEKEDSTLKYFERTDNNEIRRNRGKPENQVIINQLFEANDAQEKIKLFKWESYLVKSKSTSKPSTTTSKTVDHKNYNDKTSYPSFIQKIISRYCKFEESLGILQLCESESLSRNRQQKITQKTDSKLSKTEPFNIFKLLGSGF